MNLRWELCELLKAELHDPYVPGQCLCSKWERCSVCDTTRWVDNEIQKAVSNFCEVIEKLEKAKKKRAKQRGG